MIKIISLLFISLCISCSTASVGTKKLRFETDWSRSTLLDENFGFRHAERTAPLVEGETIYQGNGLDSVVAYDTESGNLKWRFKVKNGVESGFAIDERLLFFGASDGQFYALNKTTGKISWSFPTRTENLGAPLLHNGMIFFLAGNNVLYALDAKTGKQIWYYNRGDASSLSIRGASRPTAYKNTLYAGFSDGYLLALNINDGSINWERKLSTNPKFVDVDATAVVDENSIWISSYDGALYCLSRIEGQVQWRVDDGGSVPVTIDGEKLYYPSLSGNIYALNKKTGSEIWKYKNEEKYGVPSQILLTEGFIFYGLSDGNLVVLNQEKGKKITDFMPGVGVFATPVLDTHKKSLFVYSNQANLYKLKFDWYSLKEDQLKWKN